RGRRPGWRSRSGRPRATHRRDGSPAWPHLARTPQTTAGGPSAGLEGLELVGARGAVGRDRHHAGIAALEEEGVDLAVVDLDVGQEPTEAILARLVVRQPDLAALDQLAVQLACLLAEALDLGGALRGVDAEIAQP